MFSLLDLRFVLCSRDLHVLSAQRIMGFFHLNYPQINGVRKSNRTAVTSKEFSSHFVILQAVEECCGVIHDRVRSQLRIYWENCPAFITTTTTTTTTTTYNIYFTFIMASVYCGHRRTNFWETGG